MSTLVIPSKTFLLGEYAVLERAPALIMATTPYFSLQPDSQPLTFHPQSPAGQLLKKQAQSGRWVNPHTPLSGFGSSSAEWLACRLTQQASIFPLTQQMTQTLWDEFPRGTGSGADLVTQCLGQITCFQSTPWQASSHPWPFPDLKLCLIHTKKPLATHTHLQEKPIILQSLIDLAHAGKHAFLTANQTDFLAIINQTRHHLRTQNLEAQHTQKLLDQLNHPSILAKKGCGAMGAEVILLCYPKRDEQRLASFLTPYQVIANTDNLATGAHQTLTVSN